MNIAVMENVIKKLDIPATLDTPKIDFNHKDGKMIIEGKSFPPNVALFYQRVNDWIDNYMKTPCKETILILKLDYFNTASSKIILDILYKFEKIYHKGYNITVKWYYPEDDEDMQETGNEYSDIVDVPFEQVGYTVVFT